MCNMDPLEFAPLDCTAALFRASVICCPKARQASTDSHPDVPALLTDLDDISAELSEVPRCLFSPLYFVLPVSSFRIICYLLYFRVICRFQRRFLPHFSRCHPFYLHQTNTFVHILVMFSKVDLVLLLTH